METNLESFTDVIRQHQASVFAVAYGVTGDRALSEDVVQETFVVAWRDRGALRDPAKLPQWLRGIARNLARQARGKAGPIAEGPIAEGAALDPRDESIADEEVRMTWAALRELPET
jgi:RNA polymerase sigma-70 factor (ECF subfamily)